jgi:hypothetical protein
MKKCLLLIVGLCLFTIGLSSQSKPVIVVQPFTKGASVELPYDLKQLQGQLVAEFKVMLGKEYDIAAEPPAGAQGAIYTLEGEITGWRPGNAAKRIIVGLGSGREATDLQYRVMDGSGKKVLEQKDTVRTNFYAQSGSTGTLGHPIAQKIAERIKDAKLK